MLLRVQLVPDVVIARAAAGAHVRRCCSGGHCAVCGGGGALRQVAVDGPRDATGVLEVPLVDGYMCDAEGSGDGGGRERPTEFCADGREKGQTNGEGRN